MHPDSEHAKLPLPENLNIWLPHAEQANEILPTPSPQPQPNAPNVIRSSSVPCPPSSAPTTVTPFLANVQVSNAIPTTNVAHSAPMELASGPILFTAVTTEKGLETVNPPLLDTHVQQPDILGQSLRQNLVNVAALSAFGNQSLFQTVPNASQVITSTAAPTAALPPRHSASSSSQDSRKKKKRRVTVELDRYFNVKTSFWNNKEVVTSSCKGDRCTWTANNIESHQRRFHLMVCCDQPLELRKQWYLASDDKE
ncbi:hypothetical protein FGB62_332g00 [Gracilaria domingensis]|nr:hypothetical protein FGB62_332g00 [Gracilaria domingensis]